MGNAKSQKLGFQIIPADVTAPLLLGSVLAFTDPLVLVGCAEQHLDGGRAQRIEVILDGDVRGMYVDDLAHLKDLPRNERATALYRSHYVLSHPFVQPESLPYIAGTAVLFTSPVCNFEAMHKNAQVLELKDKNAA